MSNPPTDEALVLHVFRVSEGLGNACFLELPDGSCAIIDWGTQREETLLAVLELIRGREIRFVAATHAHADHTLGLAGLFHACREQGITVERFVYPASTLHRANAHLTQARLVALRHGIPMTAISVDDFPGPETRPEPPYLAWGKDPGWEVRALSPPQMQIADAEIRAFDRDIVPGNETSLVLLFRFDGETAPPGVGRALLPGDATPASLRSALHTAQSFPDLRLDNQAFVVPHHGSSKNLPHWMEDHLHGLVVVSSTTNSLHHPAAEVLERLSRRTCQGDPARLFCTSYAKTCAQTFGTTARGPLRLHVQPGRCFGDLIIRVPRSEPAVLVHASAPGESRRPFGFCGNAV